MKVVIYLLSAYNVYSMWCNIFPQAMLMLVYLFSHCCAGPKALKKFKRLMMCRIKWKPKKAAAGEWACVCGVEWAECGRVCVVQQVCGRVSLMERLPFCRTVTKVLSLIIISLHNLFVVKVTGCNKS